MGSKFDKYKLSTIFGVQYSPEGDYNLNRI